MCWYIFDITKYIKFGYNMNLPLCQDCPATFLRVFSYSKNLGQNSKPENVLYIHSIILILMMHLVAFSFLLDF